MERRVGVFKSLDLSRVFDGGQDLQNYTDETLQRDSIVRKCPVTGKSVHETWLMERELLRPLPEAMPMPFDLIKQAAVYKDCTIRFEGRTYSVPYRYCGKVVEVRGCSGVVQIVDPSDGTVLKQYPRKTEELLLIDQDCYEKESDLDCSIPRPLPLGRMARHLEEIASQNVVTRSIDFYDAIARAKSTQAYVEPSASVPSV